MTLPVVVPCGGMTANSGRPFVPNDPRTNRRGPVGKHALGFAKRVREATKNGEDNLDFAIRVRDGKVLDQHVTKLGDIVEALPPVKVRLEAAIWLTERGLGKGIEAGLDEDDAALANKSELEILSELADHLPDSAAKLLADRLLRRLTPAAGVQ